MTKRVKQSASLTTEHRNKISMGLLRHNAAKKSMAEATKLVPAVATLPFRKKTKTKPPRKHKVTINKRIEALLQVLVTDMAHLKSTVYQANNRYHNLIDIAEASHLRNARKSWWLWLFG